MKKILSVLLAVMLIATCFTTVAFAAGSVEISGSKTAEAGQTVDVSVTFSGDHAGYGLYVTAGDPLTIVNISGTEIYNGDFIADAGKTDVSSRTITVTVSVADDAAADTYPINFELRSDGELYNAALEDLSFSANVYVKVNAAECVHNYEGKVTTEAGCETTGVMTYTCSKCGHSYTEDIAALGHNYEPVVTEPDCENGGYTTYTCSRCGDSYTDNKTDALGHDWSDWTVVKEATETEDGLKQRTCANCLEVEEQIIPAKGHQHKGEWKVVREATCTEDGLKQLICGCGEVLDEETIPALGHDYDYEQIPGDDKYHIIFCSRCDFEDEQEHEFGYDHICDLCEYEKAAKPSDPDKDDVLKTGDITPYITFTAAALIAMVAAAGYVLKRKFVK